MSERAKRYRLPLRCGDGYNYGGEWCVCVDGIVLIIGCTKNAENAALLIENSVNYMQSMMEQKKEAEDED